MNLFDEIFKTTPAKPQIEFGQTLSLSGTVENIRYYKEDSGWAAIVLKTSRGNLNVTGIMPGVRTGMNAEVTGKLEDTKYGPTFKADMFMESLPTDIEGIEKYLASEFVKFVGPVTAKKITEYFGENTLKILDNNPERLIEVKGVGKKRIEAIIESLKNNKEIKSIMIWLKRYDITRSIAAKIYQTYGTDSVRLLEENPYRLADDLHGVGFKKADDVARKIGIPDDSAFRIRSGIKACLEDRATDGNTCYGEKELIKRVASKDYLDLKPELVKKTLHEKGFKGIVIDGDDVFLTMYYKAEKVIATKLLTLGNNKDVQDFPDFARIEKATGFTYSDEQKSAMMMAALESVLIITGGPGTGKTATTNAIINHFESENKDVLLAAPTGRAAKRMNEVTKREAKTIHRLLEYSNGSFTRCEDYPLDGDVLIVDESSMIDTMLMKDLLCAVPYGMKVIFVGDVDQLPSVGAGCVLRDLIDSGKVTTVRLTQVYRQAQGSAIIMGAHSVNHGYMPKITNEDGTDLWLFRVEDKEAISNRIVDLVTSRIPKKFGYKPEDIQVLTPMRREWDPIAAASLNVRLQEAINPMGAVAARKGDLEFRIGDKIMQIKNNYDKEIFNGDIGIVKGKLNGTDEDKAVMTAEFEGRIVRFTQTELGELELAYACTVHKSQGSEYPVVVIPIHSSQFIMLKRNLLYTGITRAKKQCILVGMESAIQDAVRREDTVRRITRLKERLSDVNIEDSYRPNLF